LPWQGARSKKKIQKVGTFPTIDHFVGLFFKNQWGLYRGDLNGFYQSFVKVILKKLTTTISYQQYLYQNHMKTT
jgi:hypothetical protein